MKLDIKNQPKIIYNIIIYQLKIEMMTDFLFNIQNMKKIMKIIKINQLQKEMKDTK